MYRYRLTNIAFNDGTSIVPGNLVVIVGPNNVGKSRALRDLASICAPQQGVTFKPLVVTSATWNVPNGIAEVAERDKLYVRHEPNGSKYLRSLDVTLAGERSIQVDAWTDIEYHTIATNPQNFANFLASQFIGHLNTQSRLTLVQQIQSPQWYRHSQNLMHNIYSAGAEVTAKIDAAIKKQFGVNLALDFSGLTQLVFRVAKDMAPIPPDPRDAAPILERYERLDDQGDGIRAFTGILSALVCAYRDVFLIDEPEAFLHPPQAFRVGEMLAESASADRQIFVATHSADILQGIISKTTDVTVVRIDRVSDTNSFRVLEPTQLQNVVVDPLLRSARVLDGIFYPSAVVVEADSDARFYHLALRKLSKPIEANTVSAQNKQTVARIRSLYYRLGVKCVGLVDFDVLNDLAEFRKQIEALGLDDVTAAKLEQIRDEIATFVESRPLADRALAAAERVRALAQQLDATQWEGPNASAPEKVLRLITKTCNSIVDQSKPWSTLKETGRNALSPELRVKFDELEAICANAGLIINRYGELESLLVDQGIPYTTNKQNWIQTALALLPNLQVDNSRALWKLMDFLRDRLSEPVN